MRKTRKICTAICLAAIGTLLFYYPLQAAGDKEVSGRLRVAVKAETTNICRDDTENSEVVKTLAFGQKMRVREIEKDWYRVPGGYIKKSDVVLYDQTKKHIALTFDDGPNETNTKTVLDALEEHEAKATFMVIGQNINDTTGELLARELELGCEIGNHSYSHANFKIITPEEAEDELKKTDGIVKEYTGAEPTLIRAPYGLCENNVLCCMDRPNISWSVDTEDWKYKDSERLIRYVTENAADGGIVLMHDIHKATAQAVDSILDQLIGENYEMVTVTELSAIKGIALEAGKTYRFFQKEAEEETGKEKSIY